MKVKGKAGGKGIGRVGKMVGIEDFWILCEGRSWGKDLGFGIVGNMKRSGIRCDEISLNVRV